MKTNAKISLVIVAMMILAAPGTSQGQPKKPDPSREKKTTVADKKYGEGGTLHTTSDEKGRLLSEVWIDKGGAIREKHYLSTPNHPTESWSFYFPGYQNDQFR